MYVGVSLLFRARSMMQKRKDSQSEATAALLLSWVLKAIAKYADLSLHVVSEQEEELSLHVGQTSSGVL